MALRGMQEGGQTMQVLINFQSLPEQGGREVIRCLDCGLVQFVAGTVCRRCRIQLRIELPDPVPPGESVPTVRRPRYEFSQAIRFWREAFGISQGQLAMRMSALRSNVSRNGVQDWRKLQPQTYIRYAHGLGISPRLLVLTAHGLGSAPLPAVSASAALSPAPAAAGRQACHSPAKRRPYVGF